MLCDFELPQSLPVQEGYYRSKLFNPPSGTNAILAAASPLFSLLERFASTKTLLPIAETRENLDHEWKAYRSRLATLKYTPSYIVIAEYLISATLDELLGKTYLRVTQNPVEFKAFTPSSFGEHGPEKRFFDLVHFMKSRPQDYLDLIELAYYCLTLGFEGELHLKADGRQTLENIIQELYELIQTHRVHKTIKLFKDHNISSLETPAKKQHPLFWKAIIIGLSALTIFFLSTQFMLEKQAKTIYLYSQQLDT